METQIKMGATDCNEGVKEDSDSESDYYDALCCPNYEMQLVQALFNVYVEAGEENNEAVKDIDLSEFWPFTFCKIILSKRGLDEVGEDVGESKLGWAWEGKDFVFRSGIAFSEGDEMAKCVLQVARSKLVLKTASPPPEVEQEETKTAEYEKDEESHFQSSVDHAEIAENKKGQHSSKPVDTEVESRGDNERRSLKSRVDRNLNSAATSPPENLELQNITVLNGLPDSNVEVERVTLSSETKIGKPEPHSRSCKNLKNKGNKSEEDKEEDHGENDLIVGLPPITVSTSLKANNLLEKNTKLKGPSPMVKTASPSPMPKQKIPCSSPTFGKGKEEEKVYQNQEQAQITTNAKENDEEEGNGNTELKTSRNLRKRKARSIDNDASATTSPSSSKNVKYTWNPVDLNEIQNKDNGDNEVVNNATHKNTVTKRGRGRPPRKCRKSGKAEAIETVDKSQNKEGAVGTGSEINPCENSTKVVDQVAEQLPFPCPYCSETFIGPEGLIAHLPVHMGYNDMIQETSRNSQNESKSKSSSEIQAPVVNETSPCSVTTQGCDDNGSEIFGTTSKSKAVQKSLKINGKCEVEDEAKMNGVRDYDAKVSIIQVKLGNRKRGFKRSSCKRLFSPNKNSLKNITVAHSWSSNTHNRQHHRPHGCGKCLKRFATFSQLRKHSQSHSVEKLYKCSHCNMQFKCLQNLRRHTVKLMMDPTIDNLPEIGAKSFNMQCC